MNKLIYPLKKISEAEAAVYVPKHLFPQIQRCERIAFGSKQVSCRFKPQEGTGDYLRVTSRIWNDLKIPYEAAVHLIIHHQTVHIGPLIGIFTAGFSAELMRPVGDRSFFFARLLAAEKSVSAFTYIFGKHCIDWEQGVINGYFYTPAGWERHEVPIPDVVYDRLPNRRTEKLSEFAELKKRFVKEYHTPWFNPGFFDKWTIHQIFSKYPASAIMLPKTIKNPTKHDIEHFLEEYGQVYLKPVNGSLGNGILQIIKAKTEPVYYARYREDDTNKLRRYRSLPALLTDLNSNAENNEDYLLQQGILLTKLQNRKLDFRVHTNKNSSGTWQATAIAAKTSGPGSLTTHVNSGGGIYSLQEIYTNQAELNDVKDRLTKAVLTLSEIVEQHIKGPIGEIGFDLGIDKENHLWLFEANSKPGRSIFYHPDLKDAELLTRKYPISYGLFLAEQAIKSGER